MTALVATAAPLIALAMDFKQRQKKIVTDEAYKQLIDAVKKFETDAQNRDYSPETILSGRYLVCAWLDELFAWNDKPLLSVFQKDATHGEHFYTILEKCFENPSQHIDLLELGYLCLSLGFQGDFASHNGDDRSEFIDTLYNIIKHERGDLAPKWFLDNSGPAPHRIKTFRLPPFWLTGIVTIVIMACIYFPYHRQLEKQLLQTQQSIQTLGKNHAQ